MLAEKNSPQKRDLVINYFRSVNNKLNSGRQFPSRLSVTKMKRNKKAQEEMVGFVLIMVVVAVIFLVFLGIFVSQRNSETKIESADVSQFLDAALEYTTTCSQNSGYTYLSLEDAIISCYKGEICEKEGVSTSACEVVESVFKDLIESAWVFSPESKTTGYESSLIFIDSVTGVQMPVPNFDSPSMPCATTQRRGADKPLFAESGSIIISLELC